MGGRHFRETFFTVFYSVKNDCFSPDFISNNLLGGGLRHMIFFLFKSFIYRYYNIIYIRIYLFIYLPSSRRVGTYNTILRYTYNTKH